MANICSNKVEVNGDKQSIQALSKRLLDQDEALIKTVPFFKIDSSSDYAIYCAEDIVCDDTYIEFRFGSPWGCPVDAIVDLSSEYPDVVFEIIYEEGGSDSYGELSIHDGCVSENRLEGWQYYEKYNEGYQYELKRVKYSTRKYFNKFYSRGGYDSYPYSYLDLLIVKKIKDDDLPLFLNREWMNKEAERLYKNRLSGGSTVQSNE